MLFEHAIAARPIDEGDREDAEDFDGGIKEREREDRVAPGQHVVAIAAAKFGAGFLFAVEELHDAHAGNVFLEIGVDAGDGGTYAAIGVAYEHAEEIGDDKDEGEDGECVEGEAMVDGKKPAGEDREEEEIVDHGDDAGGEEVVEGVDVGGDAGDQAADGVAVEVGHRQPLDVTENRGAHVVHGLLADALHDANLDVLREESRRRETPKKTMLMMRTPRQAWDSSIAVVHSGHEIFVDRDLEELRRRELRAASRWLRGPAPGQRASDTGAGIAAGAAAGARRKLCRALLLRECCSCVFELFFQQLLAVQSA